jgi:hypothetical protein
MQQNGNLILLSELKIFWQIFSGNLTGFINCGLQIFSQISFQKIGKKLAKAWPKKILRFRSKGSLPDDCDTLLFIGVDLPDDIERFMATGVHKPQTGT